jgi:hypothetical protein
VFESHETSNGTRYTFSVALLVLAFVFSPALLILSRPVGLASATLAVACSGLCVVLAWLNWNKYSQKAQRAVSR